MKYEYFENKELKAYAFLFAETVEYGFFGEGEEEHIRPIDSLTEGYHYEKGGEKYRRLCEWIVDSLL